MKLNVDDNHHKHESTDVAGTLYKKVKILC